MFFQGTHVVYQQEIHGSLAQVRHGSLEVFDARLFAVYRDLAGQEQFFLQAHLGKEFPDHRNVWPIKSGRIEQPATHVHHGLENRFREFFAFRRKVDEDLRRTQADNGQVFVSSRNTTGKHRFLRKRRDGQGCSNTNGGAT